MRKSIRLREFAKRQGITYKTAHRWYQANLISGAYQAATGAIFVYDDDPVVPAPDGRVVTYSRVSSHSRREELQYQVRRCQEFCAARGLSVAASYYEVASGMNDSRKKLWDMLNSNPTTIVVENKDRLTRFGFTYLENLLKERGCQIIVMNPSDNDEQDLLRDMVSVITSFCCRLYGLRRTKNKVARIKEVVKEVAES